MKAAITGYQMFQDKANRLNWKLAFVTVISSALSGCPMTVNLNLVTDKPVVVKVIMDKPVEVKLGEIAVTKLPEINANANIGLTKLPPINVRANVGVTQLPPIRMGLAPRKPSKTETESNPPLQEVPVTTPSKPSKETEPSLNK